MKTIYFYFDPISPYVYLAWTQIPNLLTGTGAQLECVPVLFAGFLNAHGQKGPAEIPSKRVYVMKDAWRCAAFYGVPIEGPPRHPFNPLPSLRMCVAIDAGGEREHFIDGILKSAWALGQDITQPEVLIALADGAGLNGKGLWDKANGPSVKDRLRQNTAEALKAGVFGVPTFRVGEELFWGNDRIDFLRRFLTDGKTVDAAKLARVLARPRQVDRPQVKG